MEASPSGKISRDLIPTGIAGLDGILYGGIIKGNVIVLEGMPGVGKTTLALEFIYRGAKEFNEPGVIVAFESSPDKLKRDAAGFGWDLDELEQQGKIKIVYTTPSVLLEELQSHDGVLSTEIQKIKAKRVVIDGLTPLKIFGEKLHGRPFRDSLHLLVDTLIRLETTPVLTTETFSTNPIGETGAGQEQFLCDTIITLRNQARRRSVHRSIEIAKSRGQNFISGRHSFKIVPDLGIQVFPRMYSRLNQKLTQKTSTKRSSLCNPAIDEMLGGGVLDGSTTLVVGISGTGKSVLGMEFLSKGAEEGKKGLLVTLDEHSGQICRNADGLGLKFTEYVNRGDIEILYDTPMELDVDEHFYKIKKLIEDNNIERVVIDSLAAYEAAQPEESHEFAFSLAAYFKDRLIVSLLNFECPELLGISQISDELKASALVDNIILLNYVEISTMIRRAMTIPKARGSKPDQRTREFIIQAGGITVLDDTTSEAARVPQLPLSSYYGVLARSPTRHSPVIEEHVKAGKPLPKSRLPKAKVDSKAEKRAAALKASKVRSQ